MILFLYNQLSNTKSALTTNNNTVTIYNCGITVYGRCHVGHGRSQITADVLIRYLKHLGYIVKYVRNITDIDDKIVNYASINNVSIEEVTQESIKHMRDDFVNLNLLVPDHEPRATAYIDQIIGAIDKLLKKDCAYIVDGSVYFSVKSYEQYGLLSKRAECHRLLPDPNKRHKNDFALWKADKIGYRSPWGIGRPGWHIECSVMAADLLGPEVDIHMGGSDLIFPHHENEIAQSFCLHNTIPARYWVHTALVQIDGKKMSKSKMSKSGTSNFINLYSVLSNYGANTLRYMYLSHNFRKAMSISESKLLASYNQVNKLLDCIIDHPQEIDKTMLPEEFSQYMNDNLATYKVIRMLHRMASSKPDATHRSYIYNVMSILGFNLEGKQFNAAQRCYIKLLVGVRQRYKDKKDFMRADCYRKLLLCFYSVELTDNANGTVSWRFTKNRIKNTVR